MNSKRILMVHWQETFVERCQEWLELENFELHTVFTGQSAREALQTEPFELLVLALELPDENARDLLDFLRREMGLGTPVLLLAQEETLSVEFVQALTRHRDVTLIKQPDEVFDLLEGLWQALDSRVDAGIRGELGALELPSLITLLCNEGLQAGMHIEHDHQRAALFFERGELVHCQVNGRTDVLTGKEAAYEALTWHEGYFAIRTGEQAPEQTIHENWAGVLLEGLQRADEVSFDQEQLASEDPLGGMEGMTDDLFEPPAPAAPRAPKLTITETLQAQVEEHLKNLHVSLNPRFSLLTDRSGRLVASVGELSHSRLLSLAALIAGSFSATSEVAEMIAQETETPHFQQSLQESKEFSLYSIKAGPSWILALVFDPERTNLGLARLYLARTAADLAELFAENTGVSQQQQQEVGQSMNDLFRHEVSDALEDLFG